MRPPIDDAGYYATLGVAPSATAQEIRRAYKRLAVRYHPDRIKSHEERAAAEATFQAVSEAWAVLKVPLLREVYDRDGKEGLEELSDDGDGGGDDDDGDGSSGDEGVAKTWQGMAGISSPSNGGARAGVSAFLNGAASTLAEQQQYQEEGQQQQGQQRQEIADAVRRAEARMTERMALAAAASEATLAGVRQELQRRESEALRREQRTAAAHAAEVARYRAEMRLLTHELLGEGEERVRLCMARHTQALADAARAAEAAKHHELEQAAQHHRETTDAAARAAAHAAATHALQQAASAGGLSRAAVQAAAAPLVEAARAEGEALAEARYAQRATLAAERAAHERAQAVDAAVRRAESEAAKQQSLGRARLETAERAAVEASAQVEALTAELGVAQHMLRQACVGLRHFRHEKAQQAADEAAVIVRRVGAAMRIAETRLMRRYAPACSAGGAPAVGAEARAASERTDELAYGAHKLDQMMALLEREEAERAATEATARASEEAALREAEVIRRVNEQLVAVESHVRREAEAAKEVEVREATSRAMREAAAKSEQVVRGMATEV